MGLEERDKAASLLLFSHLCYGCFSSFSPEGSTLQEGGVVAVVSSQGSEEDRQRREMDLGGHVDNNWHSLCLYLPPSLFF